MSKPVRVSSNFPTISMVCRDHYDFGPVRACPFPGCINGVEGEEISVEEPFRDLRIYRRAKWTTADGKPSYSWTYDDDFLFLSIKQIFWRDAVRFGLVAPYPPEPPTIYQYTSLTGFLGIVESGEIWLSDYAYLNDASELRHGLEMSRAAFDEASRHRQGARDVLLKWGQASIEQHRICVASFSLDGDSLSQWRGYGPIAIGFRADPLAFGYSNSSLTRPVFYDTSTQRRMLDLLAHLTASAYELDFAVHSQRADEIYEDGADWLLDLVAFFKNPGFVDEREVRIVHSESPKVYKYMDRPPKRFRVSGDLIVPYVTTRDIGRNHPLHLPIEQVVIGPSPSAETLRMGVLEALAAKGYSKVPVKTSTTPFRR